MTLCGNFCCSRINSLFNISGAAGLYMASAPVYIIHGGDES